MSKLKGEACRVEFSGVEVDELYVNAGLRGGWRGDYSPLATLNPEQP